MGAFTVNPPPHGPRPGPPPGQGPGLRPNQLSNPLPKAPYGRYIREGTIGTCPECHSTEVWPWGWLGKLFGKAPLGCIHRGCDRYYLREKPEPRYQQSPYLPDDFR